jgi:hypothetical protein
MIIYDYNDMSHLVLYQNGFSTSVNFSLIDFFASYLFHLFINFFGFILGSNILSFAYYIATFIFSYLLFSSLNSSLGKRQWITILFSLLFASSLSFTYRVISLTPNLYTIFVFPLSLYLLIRKLKPFYFGVLHILFLGLSSYYTLFSLIVVCFWYILDKNIRRVFLFSLPLLLGITVLFFPVLVQNTYLGNYEKGVKGTVYRPIEDHYNFSFRPWYFVIPPQSSIFFGDLSKNLYQRIENTGYYLAQNYTEDEMAGSYMGWHFLLGMLFVAYLLLAQRFKNKTYPIFQNVYKNKELIIRSFLMIFLILLITGPPSFTIRGFEIYTPSYLMYYLVPVFRVLVRWAVVIYLFVLIINSFLVLDLYNLMKKAWQKVIFITGFLALNFVIFAIEIPVINVNEPPAEIAYFKEITPDSVPYAVYPDGDYYSIFWILSHKNYLINPRDLKNYETGFDANEFSKNIITPEGIEEFQEKGAEYLLYYPERVSDQGLMKISELNPSINSKEDISLFFESYFGAPVKVNETLIYKMYND